MRHSQRGRQDPVYKALKTADLEMLKLAAEEGYIELKYLDESGCWQDRPVSYSYSRIGAHKHRRAGQILWRPHQCFRVWQPEQSFDYALVQGSFNKERYVKGRCRIEGGIERFCNGMSSLWLHSHP